MHPSFNPSSAAAAAFPHTPILYPLLHMPPHASVSAHGNMPANGQQQQPVHPNMQNVNGQQQQPPGFHVHHQVREHLFLLWNIFRLLEIDEIR